MTNEKPDGDGGRLQEILDRCNELHADTALDAVKRWKEGRPDARAIGYLPVYIPSEVIHSVGALPVGIIGGGDRVEVIRGDAYFQSYICHLPRSTVDLGLSGKLDALDGMLFPAICDVIRNLSGMWQILFPDRLTRFIDFPQTFSSDVGGRFYRGQLEELIDAVSSLTGVSYSAERLQASIRLYDENRWLVRTLHDTRARSPERVPTYEAYLVQRAGHLLPVEEHNDLLREYLELAMEQERPVQDNARVVLVGAFCEQPPLNLIRSLELAGCYIVDDDFLLGNRILTGRVEGEGDPLDCLVESYLKQTTTWSSLYDSEGRRAADLVDRVRRTGADGVLLAAPSFCDPALLDRPVFQKALEEAGIPYTSFKYAENTGQLGGIREQVGTFAESIRLWGEAAPQQKKTRASR
ncbi:MAG: benzoyl-CoA reductase subunit C [Dehalococcoidia bacterium]